MRDTLTIHECRACGNLSTAIVECPACGHDEGPTRKRATFDGGTREVTLKWYRSYDVDTSD